MARKIFVLIFAMCLLLLPILGQAQSTITLTVHVIIPLEASSKFASVAIFPYGPEAQAYHDCLLAQGHSKSCRMPATPNINYAVQDGTSAYFSNLLPGRYLLVGDLVSDDLTRMGWLIVPDRNDVTINFGN